MDNNKKEPTKNWLHQVLLERGLKPNPLVKQQNHHQKLSPPPFIEAKAAFDKKYFKLALLALDPKEMTAFILRFKQHLSPNEIASILGLSHESLSQLFARLSNKLQKSILKFNSKI